MYNKDEKIKYGDFIEHSQKTPFNFFSCVILYSPKRHPGWSLNIIILMFKVHSVLWKSLATFRIQQEIIDFLLWAPCVLLHVYIVFHLKSNNIRFREIQILKCRQTQQTYTKREGYIVNFMRYQNIVLVKYSVTQLH